MLQLKLFFLLVMINDQNMNLHQDLILKYYAIHKKI